VIHLGRCWLERKGQAERPAQEKIRSLAQGRQAGAGLKQRLLIKIAVRGTPSVHPEGLLLADIVEELFGSASPVYLLYVTAHEGPASSMIVGPKTACPELFNKIGTFRTGGELPL
jgi:hypothetical protein